VTAHAAQGRCLLPGDRLLAAGLNAEAVISAPTQPALATLCAEMAVEGLEALRTAPRDMPKALIAAALPVVLAARDLRRLAAGKVVPMPRGVADRVAVIWAEWRGRL
jgi:phytoene synthase